MLYGRRNFKSLTPKCLYASKRNILYKAKGENKMTTTTTTILTDAAIERQYQIAREEAIREFQIHIAK